jgi:hypothetical protein
VGRQRGERGQQPRDGDGGTAQGSDEGLATGHDSSFAGEGTVAI